MRLPVIGGIEKQLARIADALEAFLIYNDIPIGPRKPDTSGEEPEVMYTDEERDFIREYKEEMGMAPKDEGDDV